MTLENLRSPANLAFALCAMLVICSPARAQPQVSNSSADVQVASPAWRLGKGPRVKIDESHRNYHTLSGRYAPFAALLANDGFQVGSFQEPLDRKNLATVDILVIANASAAEGETSAFNAVEVAAVRKWVREGGSLLLIADHAPFAGAAHQLATALGVSFRDAYAVSEARAGQDIFRSGSGLADHPITRGRGGDGPVTAVRTFSGSAFEAPGAEPLITLTSDFVLMPRLSRSAPRTPAAGLLQGATLKFGRGRVVVMGEAGMFTSQLQGTEKRLMGFGATGAEQNQRFALNIMHWLSQRRGY